MATEQKLLTAEELLLMPDNDMRTELLDGVLIEMSPPGGVHARVMARLVRILGNYVEEHALGEVLTGDPGVILRRNPDRVRAPDVCFIAKERLPSTGVPDGYLDFVPDLIAEIISPEDRPGAVRQKVAEWLDGGARLVWIVYPNSRRVVAKRHRADERIFHVGEKLDAEPVLAGFSVPVSELFG